MSVNPLAMKQHNLTPPSKSLAKNKFMKCLNPDKIPQFRLAKRQKYSFDQSGLAYLPLPIYSIEEIYDFVGLDRKVDWFYANIVEPMQQGSFQSTHVDRFVSYNRQYLMSVEFK